VVSAEAAVEVALGVEELARERLAGRHVAVRLDPHPADGLEASLGRERLDPPQQLGVVLLEEGVDLRCGLVEVQLRVALEQADRRPQRAAGLAARLRERPAPREVEVGVAREQERPGGRMARVQVA
jgi:hypothetical protein